MQDPSRKRAPSGPLGFLSVLFLNAATFLAVVLLFGLGSAAIRRYSAGGAGALAGGPSAAVTGPGGSSYAPKEYNKVCTHHFWPVHIASCALAAYVANVHSSAHPHGYTLLSSYTLSHKDV